MGILICDDDYYRRNTRKKVSGGWIIEEPFFTVFSFFFHQRYILNNVIFSRDVKWKYIFRPSNLTYMMLYFVSNFKVMAIKNVDLFWVWNFCEMMCLICVNVLFFFFSLFFNFLSLNFSLQVYYMKLNFINPQIQFLQIQQMPRAIS